MVKYKVMDKIRKGLATAALAVALLPGCSITPRTPHGSLELMTTKEATTYDAKVGVSTEEGQGVFTRTRVTRDAETGETSQFSLVDLSQKLYGGLDAVVEGQIVPGEKVSPRAGVQYATGGSDWHAYGLLTAKLDSKSDLELVTHIGYEPEISKDLKLKAFGQLETVTRFDSTGHKFSVMRPRAGLELDCGLRAGIGADVSLDSKGKADASVGLVGEFKF